MGKKYGKVLWFNDHKGYGFIQGEDGKSYFFHYTGIIKPEGQRKTIEANTEVMFDLGENQKGVIAINVEEVKDE